MKPVYHNGGLIQKILKIGTIKLGLYGFANEFLIFIKILIYFTKNISQNL